MRAVSKLERRVDRLASSLHGITPAQVRWAVRNVIPHHAIHKGKRDISTCVDCGHTWEGRGSRCPCCGARLTYHEDSRKRVFTDRAYYGITLRVREFTVVRIFHVKRVSRLGGEKSTEIDEVLQHWIDDSGRDTIMARRIAMFPYYRYCPFSLESELSLKRDHACYGYRNAYYHIEPDGHYPRMSCSRTLIRNGFRKDFHGFLPEDTISLLLSDNRFETIWKTGRLGLAGVYIRGDRDRIAKYWRPLIRSRPMSADETRLFLDHMELLEYFRKDPLTYNCPESGRLLAEHDRLARRKAAIEEAERLEETRRREAEKIAVLESKSRYFGITFGNERMIVVVLKTIEEYMDEGRRQRHCVFSNAYYGKPDSIVLSARMRDNPSKPVETVEVSLRDGGILQCFGKCNRFTEYHDEIMGLVRDNSKRFLAVK